MAFTLLTLVKRHAPDLRGDHDAAFMARYAALRTFAAHLVGADWSLLEDLIQDAYVQFTTAQPDLAQIRDLDAYLATLVRNLRVSSIRRAVTHRMRHVAVEDYDSVMLVLDASSTEDQMRTRDDLTRICQFACARKESSKAASAFVLRFFHDVSPTDVARILRTTPATVHTWLTRARREARQHLADPPQVRAAGDLVARPHVMPATSSADTPDTLTRLRAAIFATAQPPCLSSRAIERWNSSDHAKPLDVATCAHIASCGHCLERLCAHLELPSDSGPPPPDSEAGGSGGGVTSDRRSTFHDKARRRARRLREHRPQHLEISINGHHVGILRVGSSQSEVCWTVRIEEPVAFAELHSEQGVRMALLHVDPPPQGALVQELRVALSDLRSLRLALDFSDLRPVIAVEYVDPALRLAVGKQESEGSIALHVSDSAASDVPVEGGRSWWRRVWDPCWHVRRLVPATVAVFLLAATLWWAYGRPPGEPSVAALIEQAVASEAGAISASEAVHRTLTFHVRRADAHAPSSTHRIEAWTRGDTGARAVRAFDQGGHLVAGRWLIDDRDEGIELGLFDDIWATDLSASAFRQRYMSIGPCTRASDAAAYTLTCERPVATGWFEWTIPAVHAQVTPATVPSRATLVLRRADLHAVRLSLTVSVNGIEQIVTLEEHVHARLPVRDIPAGTFIPETRRLLTAAPVVEPRLDRVPTPATPSLEVRLMETVDRLGASDYLFVSRAGPNALSVVGLVSTADQKTAVLRAVSAWGAAEVIAVDIQTFEEAAERAPSRTSGPTELRLLESAVETAPIDAYLRSRMGSEQDAMPIIRALTPRVLALSERLKRHARALNAFVERFDEQTVATFDPGGARAWQALLGRHAADTLEAIDTLDAMLAPYFDADERASSLPDHLRSASRRLANEATTVDEALAEAFTAADPTTDAAHAASMLDIRQHLHRARLDARFIRGQTPQ